MSAAKLKSLPSFDWHATYLPMLARSRPSIPVFYADEMVASAQEGSPSAAKPRYAVESWRRLNLPLRFITPDPVSRADLYSAHDPVFVDEILELRRNNGFGNRDRAVAASLPFTSGAMVSAAREAVRSGGVTVAPVSGFHHAGYSRAGGYCTFNGLIVAAQVLKRAGLVRRVGILDCDHHFGDGTAELIACLGLDWIEHCTFGDRFCQPYQANGFLGVLPKFVEAMADCDLILYQAGADPHIHDSLGGWLTSEQLRKRDRIVFETAARLQVPIAWNLAGGYQEPLRKVLAIHDATMEECARVFTGASMPSTTRHGGSDAA